MKRNSKKLTLPGVVLLLLVACIWYFLGGKQTQYSASVQDVPAFANVPYVVINNNQPEFSDTDMGTEAYETYSPLDYLDRCGYAMACVGQELMPTEERGSIGQIKPSGWHTVKYDFVDGKYLYNRCHLIGYQLTGENSNERNLITGTRYMNVEGMLPFENLVADYVEETGNHVLYRVTPIFDGNNLLARGVQMEALSLEDGGEGICFNVYVYNSQPGVRIDYTDGGSKIADGTAETAQTTSAQITYILNINSGKFHTVDCAQADSISDVNREEREVLREMLIHEGYEPAGCCKP